MSERFRTGRAIGRTVYQVEEDGSERCVGLLDTPELARLMVDAVNGRLDVERASKDLRRGVANRFGEVPARVEVSYESAFQAGTRGMDVVEIWVLASGHPQIERWFRVVGSGHPLPAGSCRHVGSAITAGGALVWHLIEGQPDTEGPPEKIIKGDGDAVAPEA